ncbi:tyrosine-type recombinase/integrase [Salinicoccus siamensis]|uniref:tyrosine-type recombinase/integrase n=1 Tax=Salinicoccus siamensis TaxID=381830 RepID=UPI00360E50FD
MIVSNSDIDFIINRLDKYPDKEPLHLSNNAVTKALRHIISVLDIDKEHITLHMIRHTHCSVLLNQGLDIHYVSKRLGHANIGVTLNTYSHLLKERKQEEDKKIENFLEQEWNKV